MSLIFFLVSMVAQALLGTNVQVAYGPDNLPIQYSTQTGEVIPVTAAPAPADEVKTIQLRTFPVVTVTPNPTFLLTPSPTPN